MNLISLFKLYQSTNVTVLAIPSLNFFTIIRFQIFPIPLAQLAKNIYKLINHHIAFIWVMQTHWMILLKCNTHAQDNIFHHIWFKNAITKLFWSYAIPSCLGYISYHLSERCNTMWTHWPYHIQLSSHMHYLHQSDAIPQRQNTNIISNHIHIYITLIRVMPIL